LLYSEMQVSCFVSIKATMLIDLTIKLTKENPETMSFLIPKEFQTPAPKFAR
jgi:hypothetical protein